MTPILEARAVSVRAGNKHLLNEVTLAFAAGERVAIVGPNGAGKTTLLRTLSGELKPHSGAVWLKGKNIASYKSYALAQHRAVLSQQITVAFPFTVAEIVALGAGDRNGPRVHERVAAALATVDLTTLSNRLITTLSGGEQQRAHLARALVQLEDGQAIHGPGILLLDEPTASQDLRHQLDLLDVTRRSADRGVTIVAILHDLNVATMFADRIIVLSDGKLVCDGTPAETITEQLLKSVFKVDGGVCHTPTPHVPFVLPHGLRPIG